jgi:UDP-N-acetylglucosamine--dolichyl-phosphate N-acetylglucosaminephosphotransferase
LKKAADGVEMIIPLASIIVSVAVTFFITPYFIRFLRDAGIVGFDLQKKNRPKVTTSGGICVAFGVLAGLLTYIGLQTFIEMQGHVEQWLIPLLAVISSILIVMFVGFLDDLNIKVDTENTKEGKDIRVGLPQWLKPLLTLPAAIPLMAISAGTTSMVVPFFGKVDFGIMYPLLLIPLGVIGASNAVNMLAGFNGLETGMGSVYFLGLGIFALLNGRDTGAVIFLITFAALVGFIRYNWYPARILPGDSLTYLLGALVASGVIIGNMEKAGIIVMLPFIIEFFLKLRVKFKASCLGKLREDGKLDPPYEKKIYSWTHLIMNLRPMTEKQVTMILILVQALFTILIFLPLF